jgi:hypothetical protein
MVIPDIVHPMDISSAYHVFMPKQVIHVADVASSRSETTILRPDTREKL